jgi:hypothetical protein
MFLSARQKLLKVRTGPEVDPATDALQDPAALLRVRAGSRVSHHHGTGGAVVVLRHTDLINARSWDRASASPLALEHPQLTVKLAQQVAADVPRAVDVHDVSKP